MGQSMRQGLLVVTALVTLSGCLSGAPDLAMPKLPELPTLPWSKSARTDSAEVSRAEKSGSFAGAQSDRDETRRSDIIDGLIARRSVLERGSSYARIADATLAASARTREAELMQARMRSRAADKNWLPRLGPSVSLSSLSSFVATLVIEQVMFDNGRNKAERAFARADVEAAAVQLAQDQNDRVHTALSLYLDAEENREKAAAAKGALTRMRDMSRIMAARVEGGISDMSELNVIRSKVSELEAQSEDALRRSRTARAELAAMSAHPVDDVTGLSRIAPPPEGLEPLALALAHTQRARDIAQARIARAGFLPGLSAGAALSSAGGLSGPDVTLSSDSGFGFGTPDNLKAVEAATDAAERRETQAREDAARALAALRERRAGLSSAATRAAALAEQGRANANLFKRQFEAGTRRVSEVVGVVETMARLDADAVTAKYAAARVDIEIARIMGVLADGDEL